MGGQQSGGKRNGVLSATVIRNLATILITDPQSRALHGQFSPSDLRSQEYLANECQNSRRLKAVPAFGLPLRFLVVLISSFTFPNAELSAWLRIRIIERPFSIFQIERLNRFLPCLCCVFIGFHSCTIPVLSPKASVLLSFHDHPRFSVRAGRLYRVPPAAF
jgi:hypothetical protein